MSFLLNSVSVNNLLLLYIISLKEHIFFSDAKKLIVIIEIAFQNIEGGSKLQSYRLQLILNMCIYLPFV